MDICENTGSGSVPETNKTAKSSWPEVVGLTGEEAEKKIKEDRPDVTVQIVQPGQGVPRDFRDDRVFVYVDSAGKVEKAPAIG